MLRTRNHLRIGRKDHCLTLDDVQVEAFFFAGARGLGGFLVLPAWKNLVRSSLLLIQ